MRGRKVQCSLRWMPWKDCMLEHGQMREFRVFYEELKSSPFGCRNAQTGVGDYAKLTSTVRV